MIRIIVDKREKKSRIPDLLRDKGVYINFTNLAVGDYIVSSDIAIERKTINDFIQSVYDGRLFVQCSDLLKFYSRPILLVEGLLTQIDYEGEEEEEYYYEFKGNRHHKNIIKKENHVSLIYDALSKIAINFRIPIIHVPSSEHTCKFLITLVNNSKTNNIIEPGGPLLKRIRKGNQTYIQQLSVLSSIPGVGDKLALRLLEKFRTPSKAINASISDLARVPGFGNMRAEKMRKLLDSEYEKKPKYSQKTLLDSNDDNN